MHSSFPLQAKNMHSVHFILFIYIYITKNKKRFFFFTYKKELFFLLFFIFFIYKQKKFVSKKNTYI